MKNIIKKDYVSIEQAVMLIKSMGSDDAIQQMKALLSGKPITTMIDGDLIVTLKETCDEKNYL